MPQNMSYDQHSHGHQHQHQMSMSRGQPIYDPSMPVPPGSFDHYGNPLSPVQGHIMGGECKPIMRFR
jgi:hypothetical protein